MIEDVSSARSLRRRNGRLAITGGPFAETKEVLGGFNLIEADDMEDALRIADEVRRRVGAAESSVA